jgi:transmembrane sensor
MNRSQPPASPSQPLDAAGKAIQHQAAEWLALRQARGFSLSEQADFAEWMTADPRHAAIFSEVEASWKMFDLLAQYPHSVDVSADPDLLAPKTGRMRRRFVRFPVALAAAAAIAMGGILWFGPWHGPDAAVLQADARFMRLPDGSTVELNAGGVVTEHFTPGQRRLRLVRGEAHFSVVKDPTREFIVEADGVAVRAVGTAFNVRLEGKNVEVLVTEGTVNIAPPTAFTRASSTPPARTEPPSGPEVSATLIAGQRTVVPVQIRADAFPPLVETLAAADVDRALAWQTSRFNFDSIPLAEVVRRLNRFSVGQKGASRLTIRDGRLDALLVSGRVRADNIESFVEALESSFGVAAERRAGGEILLRQAEREGSTSK